MDTLNELMLTRAPTTRRPLLGLTVLLVEDSRYASEALRLLCLRSGARIRRADSLQHAQRHLAVYRPSVLMVDVGLPDGSGLDLITRVARATPRIEVILGISGDPQVAEAVMAAGADGFMEKPIANLATFQAMILEHLPSDRQPLGPRLLHDETVNPDPIAYRDDLTHVAQVLSSQDTTNIDYALQFLDGVARAARDHELDSALRDLLRKRRTGGNIQSGVAALAQIVTSRIAATAPI